jgi:hypothetical protein
MWCLAGPNPQAPHTIPRGRRIRQVPSPAVLLHLYQPPILSTPDALAPL